MLLANSNIQLQQQEYSAAVSGYAAPYSFAAKFKFWQFLINYTLKKSTSATNRPQSSIWPEYSLSHV